ACCTTSERARWLASNTKGDTPAAYGRMASGNNGDGGWNIKEPDWDVHACFDAVFILRQLGGDGKEVGAAIYNAANWALSCRNADGGFGHFPGRPSEGRGDIRVPGIAPLLAHCANPPSSSSSDSLGGSLPCYFASITNFAGDPSCGK